MNISFTRYGASGQKRLTAVDDYLLLPLSEIAFREQLRFGPGRRGGHHEERRNTDEDCLISDRYDIGNDRAVQVNSPLSFGQRTITCTSPRTDALDQE